MNLARSLLPIAAVLAALGAAAPAQAAPPPNDDFANARVVEVPSRTAGTTVEATREEGEPAHQAGTKAVWYAFTPTADGAVQIDACEATFDAVLTVYSGATLSTLRREAADDDSCGGGDTGPRVTMQVRANTRYSIAVTAFSDDSSGPSGPSGGTFSLDLAAVEPPANDAFADAQRITQAGRFTGSSTLATREFGEPRLSSQAAGRSVWFRYRPRRTQRIVLDTIGSDYDTVLGVYRGDLGRLRRVARNDDGGPGTTSQVTIRARRGRTYHIVVDGFGSSGNYELGLSDGSAAGVGLEVDAESGQTLNSVETSGLRAKLACARPCRVDLRALVSRTTAQRLGLGRNRTLGRIAGRLGGSDRELPAVLRLSRRARNAIDDEQRLTITVRARLMRSRHPDRSVSDEVTLMRTATP